jgi:hypothetical protein
MRTHCAAAPPAAPRSLLCYTFSEIKCGRPFVSSFSYYITKLPQSQERTGENFCDFHQFSSYFNMEGSQKTRRGTGLLTYTFSEFFAGAHLLKFPAPPGGRQKKEIIVNFQL